MAPLPDNLAPNIEDAFTADRVIFWTRFTSFSKFAVIALVVLLMAMYLFLV